MTSRRHLASIALLIELLVASCAGSEISSPAGDAGIQSCAVDNGGCGSPSAWYCTERPGQGPACVDRNECQILPYPCSETPLVSCSNTVGGFECGPCPAGYEGNGTSCTDIDECATNNGGCGNPQLFSCTDLVNQPPACTDVDECATNNGGCGPASAWQCANLVGQPPTCTDIDECATPGSCSTNPSVSCTNLVGSYTCGTCPSGYSGDGRSCTDINECALDTDACPATSRCSNTPGSFECIGCPADKVVENAPSAFEWCNCPANSSEVDGVCHPFCPTSQTRWICVSNSVAYDRSSGRRWQRAEPFVEQNHDSAIGYCAGLSLDGVGGWRLPTRNELLGIVDSSSTPKLNTYAFPTAGATTYWSSTLVAGDYYFYVSFQDGNYYNDYSGSMRDVRCVR